MRATRHAGALLAVGAVLSVVIRHAWVSDDAFITLRTVDNGLHGYGLRFNPAERVQAYTHPLWMLVLLVFHAAIRDPWRAAVGAGLLFTALTLGLLVRRAANLPAALLALALFVSSKATVDYATSGLENPLTHLLLLLAFLTAHRRSSLASWVLSGALLTRPDAAPLFVPLWLYSARHAPLRSTLLGLLPLVAWSTFSTVYYGIPLPNTALAKLGAGIDPIDRLVQGARYLVHPFWYDHPTALALVALLPAIWRGRGPARALALGAVFHLLYVVAVGGDFMAGRFLTPVLFTICILASRLPRVPAALLPLPIALSLLAPTSPLRPGALERRLPAWSGIVDERGFYYHGGSLWGSERPGYEHRFARAGRRARERGQPLAVRATVGYFGYYAGPEVHVLDPLGLTEPLLARLPARYDPHWRIGHHRRPRIPGYDPSRPSPPSDPRLAALHRRVLRLTRGDLLDPWRWIDGLLLLLRPPPLPPLRFADARTGDRGKLEVPPEGLCLLPGFHIHADPGTRLHLVAVAHDRPLSRSWLSADPSGAVPLPPPVPGTERLCLFPGDRGSTRPVTIIRLGTSP